MKPTYLLLAGLTVAITACGKTEPPQTAEIQQPMVETPLQSIDSPPVVDTPVAESTKAELSRVESTRAETPVAEVPVSAMPPADKPKRPQTQLATPVALKPLPVAQPAPSPATTAVAAPPPKPETPVVTPPAPPSATNLAAGRATYQQACAFCHDRGAANAPKIGDAAAWSGRIDQAGLGGLYTVALHGKGAMPAKGGNRSLSDDDVKAAVDYMIAQSRK